MNGRRALKGDWPPDAFTLFCIYHLGITVDDGYQKPDQVEIAQRYGVTPEQLKELLLEFGLDDAAIQRSDFDLAGAKLDIRVAPFGISRIEIARDLYQDFLDTKQQSTGE